MVQERVKNLTNLTSTSTPQIDTGAQPHTQYILRRPVYEIEIKVVLQLGRIQHLERDLGDFAYSLQGSGQKHKVVKLVQL